MTRDAAETSPSDEQLACRAQQGCIASFERLLRRFQAPLLQFLRHQGAGEHAEDLLQDTFLRAYENLHRYRSRWSFSAWLFTIARRLHLNDCRRVWPVTGAAAAESIAARGPEPLDTLVAEEGRRRLWDVAAEALSEPQRTALWLRYVEDMPLGDIAQVLGYSRAAVKVMLFRARRKLLSRLGDFDLERGVLPPGSPHRQKALEEVRHV